MKATQHLTVRDLMIGDWVNYRPGWIDEESGRDKSGVRKEVPRTEIQHRTL